MELTFDNIIGKHILVGVTYIANNEVIEQIQKHGVIIKSNDELITLINNSDGNEFSIPSDLSAIKEAPNGEYKLYSTGEVVINPDLLATWIVEK